MSHWHREAVNNDNPLDTNEKLINYKGFTLP